MEKVEDYYLGLDIGTNSVGFCATDLNYNVINKSGKDLWGVLKMDEAQTAEKRRAKRGNRRLVYRQKQRIALLQSLFYDEIMKVDKNFFARLKASSLWEDDKQQAGIFSRNSLFFDGNLNDKEFYKKYPTIYHLRDELLTTPASDIRFLYLAIHNMLKHRGNFLLESFNGNSNEDDIVPLFKKLQNAIKGDGEGDFDFLDLSLNDDKLAKLHDFYENLEKFPKISDKENRINEIFGKCNKNLKDLFKAIVGGSVNAKILFKTKDNDLDFDAKIVNFGVDDETFNNFILAVEEVNEQAGLICNCAKQIYDMIICRKILGKHKYFCQAMKYKFELHKEQLSYFKKVIKQFYADKYNEIFKENNNKLNNYVCYIDGVIKKKKENDDKEGNDENKNNNKVKCSAKDFYAYVKGILKSNLQAKESEEVKLILKWIEEDNFLPKLRTSSNSVIPYQVNREELIKILEVSQEKFPFLKSRDEDGTIKEKILSIFTFKIPYFVGPLSKENSKHAWIEKKTDEKVLPWNFEKIVDLNKCEEEFIKRMQNNCTYLVGEPVLPKNSLLYSEYMVLNEINALKINGCDIDNTIKEQIFNLFKQYGTVKVSQIKMMLNALGYYKGEQIVISGLNENKFNSNFNVYKNFNNILNGNIEKYRNEVEDIINHATFIYDKKRLEKWLKDNYSSILDDKQIKAIKGLNIKDWGRFSKKFLDDIVLENKVTGEVKTIIDILRSEPIVLMQALQNYDFSKSLISDEKIDKLIYDDVLKLYCSPAVKRGVWQSIKIVNEIERILGNKPKKIFIEVSRYNDLEKKGKSTNSRKSTLENIYKKLKTDFDENVDVLKENLSNEKNLNSDRLFLYYTQCGKCMYTGEEIKIDELFSKDYDIDHIYPQAVVKDDSFDNRVLVKRIANEEKRDDVLSVSIQNKMKEFWFRLKEQKLISSEKLNRLLRTKKFDKLERQGFLNRQLVITNQSAKAIIDLFKLHYGESKVVYSKAKFVTEFRHCEFEFENNKEIEKMPQGKELKKCLIKCRSMNDLHHAKDAYLNIVVGNVIDEKYTKRFYLKDNFGDYDCNLNNAFKCDKENVFCKDKHLKTIINTMQLNTPIVNFLSRQVTGQFYKETIQAVEKHQKDYKNLEEIIAESNNFKNEWNYSKIPLKSNNNPLIKTFKYGSFNNATISYFSLIKYYEKKREVKEFVAIPYLFAINIKNNNDLFNAIATIKKLDNFEIVIDKIRIGSILKLGNGYFKLAGKSGKEIKLHNFNQLYLPASCNEYFKLVEKIINKINDKTNKQQLEYDGDKILVATNRFGNKKYLTKEENLALYKELVKHLNKSLYIYTSLNGIGKKLKATYQQFKQLNCEEQVKAISGILNIINGSNGGDIRLVGGSKNSGVLSLGMKLGKKPLSLIYYSPTGFFAKEQKIV